MTEHLSKEEFNIIFAKLEMARTIVEANENDLESSEYEQGYIAAFETILSEIQSRRTGKEIAHLISSHFDFLNEVEKSHLNSMNEQELDLAHFAIPLAERIVDESEFAKSKDGEKLAKILATLFRQNQFAIEELLGTSIIESNYFEEV